MKGLVLLQNKDERAMARLEISAAGSLLVSLYGQLREGLEEIQKSKGALELLVLDERLDNALDPKGGEPLTVLEVLEAFNQSPARPSNAVVMIILNESSTLESPLRYLESGVDVFLRRPFGAPELREKVREAIQWVGSPPGSVHLMRVFHEGVTKGQYGEVLPGLETFFAKDPQNVRVGLLLAKALIRQGASTRARGIEIVRGLDTRFPDSLFSKKLLIEGYLAENQPEKAYAEASRLFALSPSADVFESTFALAERSAGEQGAQVWGPLLEAMRAQDPLRTKARRLRLLKHITGQEPNVDTIRFLLEYFAKGGQEDVLEASKEFIETWAKRLQEYRSRMESQDPLLENLYTQSLQWLLEIDPGAPLAIEAYTDLQLRNKQPKLAEKYLKRARDKSRFSTEFYAAFAKLSLAENMLKEASDMIHAGRRLAPSDDRWNELSKIWSEKYAQKK